MRDVTLALVLAVTLASGCGEGAKGGCPQLDVCGGNPAGMWTVAGFCQYQPVRPAQPSDVNDFTNMTPPLAPTLQPPQPQPVLLQQTTSGDWCSSLVVTPDGRVANAALWHEAPKLVGGQFLFIDNSYQTKLTFSTKVEVLPTARNFTHFARRCLIANGGNPSCDQLTEGLTNFYAPATPTVPSSFTDIKCTPATDGGCDCAYKEYLVQVDDVGTYLVSPDGTLLQDSTVFTFNGATAFPQSPSRSIQTSMCAAGGLLQLSGPNGGNISGLQGLRTMVLSPKAM